MAVSDEISAFQPENAPKLSRTCAFTNKLFEPGDKVYSVLYEESGVIKRKDFSASAWRSNPRPENALAWWSSRVRADADADKKLKLAPNDALAALFAALADNPEQAALRYALALLLARRRVLRFDYDENVSYCSNPETSNTIYVYSPRNETGYLVPIVQMSPEEIEQVQARLVDLLENPTAELERATVPFPGDQTTLNAEKQGANDEKKNENAKETKFARSSNAESQVGNANVKNISREERLRAVHAAFDNPESDEELQDIVNGAFGQ